MLLDFASFCSCISRVTRGYSFSCRISCTTRVFSICSCTFNFTCVTGEVGGLDYRISCILSVNRTQSNMKAPAWNGVFLPLNQKQQVADWWTGIFITRTAIRSRTHHRQSNFHTVQERWETLWQPLPLQNVQELRVTNRLGPLARYAGRTRASQPSRMVLQFHRLVFPFEMETKNCVISWNKK